MIEAYKAGIPENGKPFPDSAKMAKIHWAAKKNESAPGQPLVAGALHDVDLMVKDSKRFADSGGWGYGAFEYEAASDGFRPRPAGWTVGILGSDALPRSCQSPIYSPLLAGDNE
jgi:hypothetical protein